MVMKVSWKVVCTGVFLMIEILMFLSYFHRTGQRFAWLRNMSFPAQIYLVYTSWIHEAIKLRIETAATDWCPISHRLNGREVGHNRLWNDHRFVNGFNVWLYHTRKNLYNTYDRILARLVGCLIKLFLTFSDGESDKRDELYFQIPCSNHNQ